MYPSRNALEIYEPMTLSITDAYGESITLSRNRVAGDVLTLTVSDYRKGKPYEFGLSGNFHNEYKQNAMNFLAHLQKMQAISEQENQLLLLIVPHPQFEARGYVTDLDGPNWATTPSPLFYNYSFTFRRDDKPHQPMIFTPPIDVVTAEGEPYVETPVPVGVTTLRDFAYAYYGDSYRAGEKIRKIIELNNISRADGDSLTPGALLKMPK